MSKEIYVPVDGLAHKVTKVYAPVNGVAHSVKKVYKGVNGIARQVFEAGKSLSKFAIGDSVFLNIDNKPVEFLVVNIGIPSNSELYDDSCDGVWLLAKDCYEKRRWHSSSDSNYRTSTIHEYLNSTFIGLFNPTVQSIIREVKIPYVNGNGNTDVVSSGADGLPAKVFLLSCYEVGWTRTSDSRVPYDGASLTYFEGMTYTDARRIAYLNGSASSWTLRSPERLDYSDVRTVTTSGGGSKLGAAQEHVIRPALILPRNISVNPETNVIE